MTKTAVVLFNLGGPDQPDSVQPFLFNLFNDPAIIGLPNPFRWLLAKLISSRRAPIAREIYEHLGGGSPLLKLTNDQATALEEALKDQTTIEDGHQFATFIAMRYWHPFANECAEKVREFAPDRIILLPLYPQFSTTTTGSSLDDWHKVARKVGLTASTASICCYPTHDGWISAQASLLKAKLDEISDPSPVRVLFSAHGLPKKVVAGGDPYQWQVEQTASAVATKLGTQISDWTVCYQSRVGPLEWIGPSLDDELERAANDGVAVVIVPIAFVSEHSETLVELDIEYAKIAKELGIPGYYRVPAVGTHPDFIGGLAQLVRGVSARGSDPAPLSNTRLCPIDFEKCPCQTATESASKAA